MIAEDHKMFRETIVKTITETAPHVDVMGAAADGLELLELVKDRLPDIVLLDIKMPEMDGWEVLKVFKERYPSIKTIMFSGDFDKLNVASAILVGARAFIDKWKGDHLEIIAAVESVYYHGYYFNDLVAREVVLSLKKNKNQLPIFENDTNFSEREIEIIRLICEGKQVKEMADHLNIASSTVKYHKGNVFKKTETESNLELLKYAITRGIYNVFESISKPSHVRKD